MEEQKIIDIMMAKNYDLTVVTTRLGDKINGQTVAWVTQASINPPMVAVGISSERYTYGLLKESKVFAINFLPKSRQDIVDLFGFQTGAEVDKFKDFKYRSAVTRSPILNDAAAFLDCKVVKTCQTGDHELFIGEVVDADYKSLEWFLSSEFKKKAA